MKLEAADKTSTRDEAHLHVRKPEPVAQDESPAKFKDDQDRYLVVSPYTSQSHLLDLSSVSLPNQLLARALTSMDSVRADYATAPYVDAFNWTAVLDRLKANIHSQPDYRWADEQSFYIVVFRSCIPPTTDKSHLGALDAKAHEEATTSGGLLKYWFGTPDENGRNLATCIWRNKEDANLGSRGPGHRRAANSARDLYTEWKIERLRLTIGPEAEWWSISDWGSN